MNAQDREQFWQKELQRVTHQCPQCATVWLMPASHNEEPVTCKTCGCRSVRQSVPVPNHLLAALPPRWQLRAA